MTPKAIATKIARLALVKKGYDTVIMDLRKLTSMTDYFVICSADSDVQVKAIADAIMDGMDKEGVRTWHSEGITNRMWILLDYVDVVVHVFHKEARSFYNLERLWGDAKREEITDEPAKPKQITKTADNKPAVEVKTPARRKAAASGKTASRKK